MLAILFLFGLALHFSLLVSRLTDQSKMLAQKVALLEHDLRAQPESSGEDGADGPMAGTMEDLEDPVVADANPMVSDANPAAPDGSDARD